MDVDVYMDCPEGLEGGGPDKCLKQQKTIYGLVQSAQQFFLNLGRKLKDLGFEQNKADPCLFKRKNELGVVFVGVYVDDCYVVGNKAAVEDVTTGLQRKTRCAEAFSVTVTDDTSDYLSCDVVFSKDGKRAWLGQPHLIKNLRKHFGEDV